jgi:hypothetical protein
LTSTHAPTEEDDEAAKEEFYSSLEKVCDAVPNYDKQRILGDFNAKLGKESYLYPACVENETNFAGKRMVNFALGRDLVAAGIWYQHKDIHKVTWRSPDNKMCNQIHHILIERRQ